jgi:hypothetical protein
VPGSRRLALRRRAETEGLRVADELLAEIETVGLER